jgi:hypothetical protein
VTDRDIDTLQASMNRRALVTKLAVGAFAVPAIVAFKLDALARAGTFSKHPPKQGPDCHMPNGSMANGTTSPPQGGGDGPPKHDHDHDHDPPKGKPHGGDDGPPKGKPHGGHDDDPPKGKPHGGHDDDRPKDKGGKGKGKSKGGRGKSKSHEQ